MGLLTLLMWLGVFQREVGSIELNEHILRSRDQAVTPALLPLDSHLCGSNFSRGSVLAILSLSDLVTCHPLCHGPFFEKRL